MSSAPSQLKQARAPSRDSEGHAVPSEGAQMSAGLPSKALWLALAGAAVALPFLGLSSRWIQLLALIGINTLLAQSMNIVGGYAGQLSLGQAGIFAAGAYGSAVLSTKLGWPILLSIPAGMVFAMLVGLLVALPAVRVREFYLGMVTLAFGVIAYEVLEHWELVTGGVMGISNVPSPTLKNLTVLGTKVTLAGYCAAVMLLLALLTWLKANLIQSHVGRAFIAVESSDLAAASLGIRPGRTKHLAYVVSAAWAGLAGALYAHLTAYISPESFNLWVSVSILVMAIFGGLRTFVGPFLGAAFFTLLPELTHGFKDYQLLVYGTVLLLSYAVLPQGLASLIKARTDYIRRRNAGAPESSLQAGAHATPRTPAPLRLANVSKHFGGIRALDGVSFALKPGTIHGLIGPNGSGKSTLVNVTTGVYEPSAGQVLLGERRIDGLGLERMVGLGIARTFQNPIMFSEMTVRESVLAGAHARFKSGVLRCLLGSQAMAREEAALLARADALIDEVGLAALRDAPASSLPYGRKRMVDLARALATDPHILILDEPAAGLSDAEVHHLASLLRRLRASGMSVLLIEHHLDFLFNLVDAITVLDHGQVIYDGTPSDARRDERVIEAYLGSPADA